jgi:hypothetical protein
MQRGDKGHGTDTHERDALENTQRARIDKVRMLLVQRESD